MTKMPATFDHAIVLDGSHQSVCKTEYRFLYLDLEFWICLGFGNWNLVITPQRKTAAKN